jgi:hypothetical protein
MGLMRLANGEDATNNLYYGPMLVLDAAGRQTGLGGGLGGGGGGVGDTSYSGIFIHEMGHAFGLSHAGEAFTAGRFPYAGGSTSGSVWGYLQNRRTFLNLLVDSSAQNAATCAQRNQVNAAGRCYKQDPMQGGAEDRTAGFTYGTFSDYSIARIQEWFEGRTGNDGGGRSIVSTGRIVPDTRFASGYARWDNATARYIEFVPTLTQGGVYGINSNLPTARNVPVYTIMLSLSNTRSAGASILYAPVRHTGNLIRTFDPASATDLADFTPDTGRYNNYCKNSGCDYTLRITYANGSVIHRTLQGGFRGWLAPTAPVQASANNPLDSDSFRTWAINVPGDQTISRVELLDTPTVWRGLPSNPTVILSRGL